MLIFDIFCRERSDQIRVRVRAMAGQGRALGVSEASKDSQAPACPSSPHLQCHEEVSSDAEHAWGDK